MFVNTAWALLPPIVAIALALITKETYSSLFIGALVGALLCNGFNPIKSVDMLIGNAEEGTGMISALSDNAGLFIFFVLLGAIVCLITQSGASLAFGRWAKKHIKTKVGAMLSTFLLGVLIFIDDYFNCLTVGSVMKPVTDTHKISRPKLAYLIDATAAPICMIAPISSWAAAVSGVADKLDTNMNGIQLFIKAIPYNFYSLLTLVFIIALCLMKFDYGSMKKFEEKAMNGDLSSIDTTEELEANPKGKVLDMVLPVLVLISISFVVLLKVGGYFAKGEFYHRFFDAFGNTDAFVALPWAGLITLIFTIIYMMLRRLIDFKKCMSSIQKGFVSMIPPMIILTLAVTLKSTTSNLGLAVFVRNVMDGAASSLYSLLPAVIFLVACLLAFASGTSWGTFGILIPVVTAIFNPSSPLLIIGISACLAGAVCGDHCSPISDTTIMASAGASCEHVNHVSTQIPYAVTVAAISFVMYLFAGFVNNVVICLILGVVLTIATLFVIKRITLKSKA